MSSRFKNVVAPLKWVGLEASPVCVLAILDDEQLGEEFVAA